MNVTELSFGCILIKSQWTVQMTFVYEVMFSL